MNDLSVNVEKEVETMTSLELAKAFGQRHDNVMARLKKLAAQGQFNALVCKGVEYKDAKGELRPMLVIDFNLAMAYAATSIKKNAPALLMQLMMRVVNNTKEPKQLEQKVAQLQSELDNRPTKVVGMSSRANRAELHRLRMELHAEGVCDHNQVVVIHHYFPVNEYGIENGYRNKPNTKGKCATIDVNYRMIEPD